MILLHSSPSPSICPDVPMVVRAVKPPHNHAPIKIQNNRRPSCSRKHCFCGRRHFLEAAAAISFLPIRPSHASDSTDVSERVHPPRPDWYEELYASFMNTGMDGYEAEIADYKSRLFDDLLGKSQKVLEIGIGTGPNLHYYAADKNVRVFGVDPNPKMEKYDREAASKAGLPPENFNFIRAVGEAIPLNDASVDTVVGTLVLCSVSDVNRTLNEVKRVLKPGGRYVFIEHVAAEDGTYLKLVQSLLDPLQQLVVDGCHLTRETGKYISEAGFDDVKISKAFISSFPQLSPHVYGVAYK